MAWTPASLAPRASTSLERCWPLICRQGAYAWWRGVGKGLRTNRIERRVALACVLLLGGWGAFAAAGLRAGVKCTRRSEQTLRCCVSKPPTAGRADTRRYRLPVARHAQPPSQRSNHRFRKPSCHLRKRKVAGHAGTKGAETTGDGVEDDGFETRSTDRLEGEPMIPRGRGQVRDPFLHSHRIHFLACPKAPGPFSCSPPDFCASCLLAEPSKAGSIGHV